MAVHKTLKTLILVSLWCINTILCYKSDASVAGPTFENPFGNKIVFEGDIVELSCAVKNLNGRHVNMAWFKDTIQVARNNYIVETRLTFNLFVRSHHVNTSTLIIYEATIQNGGDYSCMVNTDPVMIQTGTLEVVTRPGTINHLDVRIPTHVVDGNQKISKDITEKAEDSFMFHGGMIIFLIIAVVIITPLILLGVKYIL